MFQKKTKESSFVSSRRKLLGMGLGSALGVLTAKTSNALTATPTETEGPFWVDLQLNRVDVRPNTATASVNASSYAPGLPLHLTINVSTLASNVSTPTKGAYVDIWHANSQGSYSDESNTTNINESYTVGQNFLRGYQVTDAHGNVRFLTNCTAYYNGRAPHIHVRIRQYSGTTTTLNYTTQLFFADTFTTAVYASTVAYTGPNTAYTGKTIASIYATSTSRTYNSQDMVYNTVTASAGSTTANPDGSQMLCRLAEDGSYAIASFNIIIT